MSSESPGSKGSALSSAANLADNHRRKIVSGLTYIERMLVDSETVLRSGGSFSLSRHKHDLSPMQVQVAADYIGRIRQRMEQAVQLLALPVPDARPSRAWEAQMTLLSAEIALEEISPKGLIGYGHLDPEAAQALDRVVSDLARLIQQLRRYLGKDESVDLEGRIARLGQAPVDAVALRRLEEIIRKRGFVEFRAQLEALLERIEDERFEIAVFGRVSSGKSSLLNCILGIETLPVGVTPVTAVPTRVLHGSPACVVIRFAESPEMTVTVEQLGDFISESGNPENRKHVTRATVHVPSSNLGAGIVFVDTPGIGSLATSGARQSYSYLPLCDLGIVLVDSTNALNQQDLELLRMLEDSGIRCLVALTKSDLLSQPDQLRTREYTSEQIIRHLSRRIPVHCVSSHEEHEEMANDWFGSEILPLFSRHRELRRESIHRKLETLRESVAAALRASLQRGGIPLSEEALKQLQTLALEGEGIFQSVGKKLDDFLTRFESQAHSALCSAITDFVSRNPTGDAAGPVGGKLAELEELVFQQTRGEFVHLQKRLFELLVEMGRVSKVNVPIDEPRADILSRPRWNVQEGMPTIPVRVPRLARFSQLLTLRYGKRLSDSLSKSWLRESAQHFSSRLREWDRRVLEQLSNHFSAQSEPFRAQTERLSSPSSSETSSSDLEQDLRAITAMEAGGRESHAS